MRQFSPLRFLRSTISAAAVTAVFPHHTLGVTDGPSTHIQRRCAGTQRRVVRPTEEGVASLMDDDDDFTYGAGGRGGSTTAESAALSSLAASATLYQQVAQEEGSAARKKRVAAHLKASRERTDAATDDSVAVNQENPAENDASVDGAAGPQTSEKSRGKSSAQVVDEAEEEIHSEAGVSVPPEEQAEQDAIAQQQSVYYEMPIQEFTDVVCAYLRASENVVLVSVQEEHVFFPVLLDRLPELHLSQLLDILACPWSRSTMLRYGTGFKDAARDRIAQLATAAATQLEARKQQSANVISSFGGRGQSRGLADSDDTLPDDEINKRSSAASVLDDEEEAIFVQDEEAQQRQAATAAASASSADAILAHADQEITAASIYRALVVVGMSGGRRKRDLAFFQLLGNYFTYFINDYRDPHQLVHVLTALSRAKIVPSPAFLNLLARRLPVLHKRVPLEPVPAYRAMSNFARMGHTSMNTFRFLADCMLTHMEKNIREEKKRLRQLRKRKAEAAASVATAAGGPVVDVVAAATAAAVDEGEKEEMQPSLTTTVTAEGKTTPSDTAPAVTLKTLSQAEKLRPELAAKQRLRRLCGLKPSTFTRLLYLLARFNAPHQQYLRPLITPVIVPMIPYFPPPSFTRLLKATQLFRSNDTALIEAYVTHVCDVLAPAGHLTRADVLELLRLLSLEDTPVPANLERFLQVCRDSLKSATAVVSVKDGDEARGYRAEEGEEVDAAATPASATTAATAAGATGGTRKASATGTVTFMLRPRDMFRVIHCIGSFQRKVEIPLETLSPLAELADDFARRLAFLMELSVVPLVQVEEFVELCTRYQIPDASGAIERLTAMREDILARPRKSGVSKAAAASPSLDTEMEAEESYYSQLDVDVRETFMKILITNDFNTYSSYRPLPGPLQVDFREELTKVSAFELLQSVDLFNKACPGALHAAPRMFLSRSLLEKVGKEGEVVVEEKTNRLVVRQPRAELLTREDLQTFVELVQRTPLEAVRNAPVMWTFIKEKAERLGVVSTVKTATQRLHELSA